MKIILKIAGILLGTIALVALIGVFISDMKISSIRKDMLADAPLLSYDIEKVSIDALPEPVQRYMKYAFTGKKKFKMKGIEWKEKGVFNLPEIGRFTISAWQVSRPDIPIYMWRGKMMKGGGLLTLESMDSFNVDKHDMRAKLYGLMTIMKSDYTENDDITSLHNYLTLRYYGTSLCFPWGLITSKYITWTGIDNDSAEMRFNIGGNTSSYIVTFSAEGKIIKMEGTEFQLHGNDELLRETSIKSEYEEWNGVMVPTNIHYVWVDKAGNKTEYNSKIYDIKILR
ncbi:MAG: hypothetical protein C0603_10960 [Denitrovibrio sp.]|nr:MAG: hypothetical protein C0603_10960 [Denitrovibrio sp.]